MLFDGWLYSFTLSKINFSYAKDRLEPTRMEVEILVKPPSRRASEEALRELRRARAQAVLLNLPENINDLVQDLVLGAIEYDDFLEEVEKRLPSPASAWIKGYEQILTSGFKEEKVPEIYCYGDVFSFKVEAEEAVKLTLLTLRGMITNRVDVEEWLRILRERSKLREISSRREAEKVADISLQYERAVCVSERTPTHIKSKLEEEGIKPRIHYLGQPHHFTPLEVLSRMLSSRRKVSREELEGLIKEHIEFIREYVYRKPMLEAIDEWSMRKLYWIPRPLDRKQV